MESANDSQSATVSEITKRLDEIKNSGELTVDDAERIREHLMEFIDTAKEPREDTVTCVREFCRAIREAKEIEREKAKLTRRYEQFNNAKRTNEDSKMGAKEALLGFVRALREQKTAEM